MKSLILKALITIAVFYMISTMLTGNDYQIYGGAGLEKLEFVFTSEYRNGHFIKPGVICPDNHEAQVFGSMHITEGILYGPGWATPQHDRSFVLSDNGTGTGWEYLDIQNWKISGAPPNQEFIVEAIETRDILCNGDAPTDITIRGSCNPDSLATFNSKNGQRGQFKIMALIGGGTEVEDHEVPICFVCAANQHGWLEVSGWSCMDDDKAAMNVDKKAESEDSGADPSGLDSSTGQVERDDRPQPPGDGEQQIKTGDNSSKSGEDTSSSNDQPSIDTK